MTAGCELWKECARWMRDLGLLTPTDQNGTMLEFASILRDGVLLCRLANALIPDSIDISDIIKTCQSSEFTWSLNITKFLDVCRTKFDMKDDELFAHTELITMTGFQKVLKTLSILSQKPEAIMKDVQPIPDFGDIQEPSSSGTFHPPVEEEDVYQSLTENIERVDPDQTIYGPISSSTDEQREKLYDRIVMARKNCLSVNESSPNIVRNRCVMELYDTEKNYVEIGLKKIIDHFLNPLKGIIRDEDHRVIFSNIERIRDLHEKILEDLQTPVNNALENNDKPPSRPTSLRESPAPRYIGEVFVKHRDKLLEYGEYCSNLPKSWETTNHLMKTNEFIRKNILECTNFENNQFNMQDLLMVPVQRITKYPLLFKELLKMTDISSPERASLKDALDIVEDICDYINEMKKDFEMENLISNIEKSIVDLCMPVGVRLKDYGRLNFDGEVKMSENTLQHRGAQKQRHVFIFDKVLVVCKASNKNSFTYKNAFIISDLEVDHNLSIDTKTTGTITRKTQYVIHLHRERTDNNEVNHIALYFKNEASREKWLNAFTLSKTNVAPTELIKDTNHKVSYKSFKIDCERPEACGICYKYMKGTYYQGYKCEYCGMTMHKSCLSAKKCDGIRRGSEVRTSHSFNSVRPRQRPRSGDVVVATTRFVPSDIVYLEYNKGDQIVVLQIYSETLFTGRLVRNTSRTGLVSIDNVKPIRSNSIIGLSPTLESPAGSILARKESTVLPRRQDSTPSECGSLSCRQSVSTIGNGTMLRVQQDYVNTEITEYPWYVGEMERADAESLLCGKSNGTFLVRFSNNRKKSAISVSYEREVKHMIIEQNSDRKVYLDDGYIFNSIVELVQYYREHNLIEIFQNLNTTLKNPYVQCNVYKAIHDYEAVPSAPEGKFLSFRKGDRILLIDTVGEDRGWWKGQANNQTGFFPLTYVEPADAETLSQGIV